jgi:hypothetical protein
MMRIFADLDPQNCFRNNFLANVFQLTYRPNLLKEPEVLAQGFSSSTSGLQFSVSTSWHMAFRPAALHTIFFSLNFLVWDVR